MKLKDELERMTCVKEDAKVILFVLYCVYLECLGNLIKKYKKERILI